LTGCGLFLQGGEIRCEMCMSKFWYHVDEIGKLVHCRGCGAGIRLPAELEWSYQPNELLRFGMKYHGLVPFLRTIRRLFKEAHECFIFLAGVTFYDYSEPLGAGRIVHQGGKSALLTSLLNSARSASGILKAAAAYDSVIRAGHHKRSLAKWNCFPFRGVAQPGSALAFGASGRVRASPLPN